VGHLRDILDRLEAPADRSAVTQCAQAMYWLYGQMFRGIDRGAATAPTRAMGAVA
jgi:hypothetical protein